MVVTLRSAVGVALIWLATVAGVSVTAWVAIDHAGRDITGGVVSSPPPVTLGSGSPLGTTTPDAGPSGTDATPEPSAAPEASATTEPSATSSDRTVSVTGGQVSVRCTGSTILLRIAQPDNGFRVEVEKAGPEEVHVIFRRGDDEGGVGAQVTAVCATGTPAFRVENSL